jgi:hypothetical protein
MAENPEIVVPRLRPLRYSREAGVRPREKGVDVELAVAALEWTLTEQCDVAVIFSHDTDLVPAVEAMVRLKGRACIETASWVAPGHQRRLRPDPTPYHHEVSEAVFERVEVRVNYAHASR